ncbi:outer membrane protein assembly factor BamA [Dyadobacter jejuensis]|uniref:Outer membrane protein assembly factor BamA n=1 Tax=Dyadobacter jejuensis TaxID=1082580 RepID=A0A316AP72_9BACT|nr:BamA/TamA family outer membrane protein [Dyadobacter jejuensis]PWJ59216.1 outer membrane protein assembly factor BamA [Dyadobacter jejuensis]
MGNSIFQGNQIIKKGELESLIPQKPNRRFLGLPFFPYVGLYQFGQLFYNSEDQDRRLLEITQKYQKVSQKQQDNARQLEKTARKYEKKMARAKLKLEEGNFWMRVVGEKPVYFSKEEAIANAEKMQRYLYNNGFFAAAVHIEPDTLFTRVRPVYKVEENRPTLLHDIHYDVNSEKIDSLLGRHHNASALKPGKRYDGDAFEQERIRLESLLRNNGYFGFSRQYISFLVNDTLSYPQTDSLFKQVDVTVKVELPSQEAPIQPYTIKSVHFEVLPPSGLPDSLFRKVTVTLNGIEYIFTDKFFSPKILNNKILVRPNTLYSQQNERESQQQLSLTDQFRFVNYSYHFDSTGHGLHSYFKAIPLEKYQISTDLGLNVIQLQGAPGPFANLSYKVRNVFNGLEDFETSIRGGIELVPGFLGSKQIYRSEEIGVNTSLNFPRILFPAQGIQNKLSLFTPRTQIGIGYNYVNRPEYTRSIVKSSMTYSWKPSQTTLFNVTLLDLNILNTQRLRSDFEELLTELQLEGNNLINSFQKSFVSDLNFNFIYNTNNLNGPPKKARYLRLAFESGGTSLNLFPKQQDWIQGVFGDLQFYKYLRTSLDYRRYWPTGGKSLFVTRINTGGIYSYGSGKVPPYEKYFFAGGSNSLRAWLPRRLGPGSAPARLTTSNISIEAPGEFLLEGNLEYRGFLTNFFGDINYALFVDAGNVWSLNQNADADQRLHPSTFLKQIAVGTGFGIRYDLSYFVLRFDFGIKVYDPSVQRFVLDELNWGKLFNRTQQNFLNVNLGVGYPF